MNDIEDTSVYGDPGEDGNDVAGDPPFDSRKPLQLQEDGQTDDPAEEAKEITEQLAGLHIDEPEAEDLPDDDPAPQDPSPEPEDQDTDIPEGLVDDPGISPIPHQIPEDLPGDQGGREAPAPMAEELQDIQNDLGALGDQVNQFNEAGGIEGGGEGGSGGAASPEANYEGIGGNQDDLRQFSDAVANFSSVSTDFLTDHARFINDLARKLEIERL